MAIGGGAGIGGGVSDWGLVGVDWARGVAIRLTVFFGGRDLMICTDRLFDDYQFRPDDVTLRAETPLRP